MEVLTHLELTESVLAESACRRSKHLYLAVSPATGTCNLENHVVERTEVGLGDVLLVGPVMYHDAAKTF
jgi:hypothetical protein